MSTKSPWIVEVTDETFEREVFDRSQVVPVVVDFWAQWCPPCRALGPILEELAKKHGGAITLVKADTAKAPGWSHQFNVQSIPAVFGVVDRNVVGSFLGAQPQAQVDDWIGQLIRHAKFVHAQKIEGTDPAQAERTYREYLKDVPQFPPAMIGLGRVLLTQGRVDEARAIVAELEKRGMLEPEAQQLKAMLEINAHKGANLDTLRASVAKSPTDLNAKIELADGLSGNQDYPAALEELLKVVEADSGQFRESARQRMVDIFRALGDDSELARDFRRKLSSALY